MPLGELTHGSRVRVRSGEVRARTAGLEADEVAEDLFLDAWAQNPRALPADVRAEYLRAARGAVPSIVADYRASAGIDIAHDQADRAAGVKLTMPVTVVQQDWGAALGFDAAALWRAWTQNLEHHTTSAGHFMAEEAPLEIVEVLRALLAR
jgi:haloacetate dehalogenase